MDIQNPKQVILVSCRCYGKDNLVTLSWHSPVSFKPELYAIMLSKKRFSYKMIQDSRHFVVNFMPYDMKKEALFCGMHTGKNTDKFKELGLKKEEAEKINCPILKKCSAYMECRLVNEVEAGDHVILVGQVLKSGIKNKKRRLFQDSGEGYRFTTTK